MKERQRANKEGGRQRTSKAGSGNKTREGRGRRKEERKCDNY